VRQEQAQGMLVAALGLLAGYYGLCGSGRDHPLRAHAQQWNGA